LTLTAAIIPCASAVISSSCSLRVLFATTSAKTAIGFGFLPVWIAGFTLIAGIAKEQ